ncbi:MAG TPA: hypothetical protein V6D48_21700, partial [Oculatellaceae cyanobacterium]
MLVFSVSKAQVCDRVSVMSNLMCEFCLFKLQQMSGLHQVRYIAKGRRKRAEGRRKRAEGFYVYYWYMVIWAVK